MPCERCPIGPGCRGEKHRRWCERLPEPAVHASLLGRQATRVITVPPGQVGRTAPPGHLIAVGHANSHTGFGIHFRHQLQELERLGVLLSIEPVDRSDSFIPADPWVLARQVDPPAEPDGRPRYVTKAAGGGDLREADCRGNVVYTMWESSRLHPRSVAHLNTARAVIVPCGWNERVFRDSGVTVPVHVVPLGIDPAVYRPVAPAVPVGTAAPAEAIDTAKPTDTAKPADRVIFLAAGRVAHGGARKGLHEVIAAFLAELGDEPTAWLVVKLWRDCDIREPGHPRVIFNREPLTDEGLANLYRSSFVFVSASKGEGWGFHPHQSLGCGVPVIAPMVGGHAEFLDESCGWPVEYDEVPCDPTNPHYGGLGNWFVPRMDSLRRALRAAFEDRDARHRKGAAGIAAARRFTWERAGRELHGVLTQYGVIPAAHGGGGARASDLDTPNAVGPVDAYRPPPLAARAVSLAKAMVTHAASGFAVASPAERDRRSAICEACPRLVPPDTCGMCGCYLSAKRAMQTATCPLGKW